MEDKTRRVVMEAINEVLADRGRTPGQVDEQTALFADGLGLDSLDFATLVVRLEQRLDFDPFRSGELTRMPRTLGDLLGAYKRVGGAG